MDNKMDYGIVRVELIHTSKRDRRILSGTLAYFREADSFLIHAACDHVKDLMLLNSREELTFMERLVHRTKDNPEPGYPEFDILFGRTPSYIRRAAIHNAVGHVRSHETRCGLYEQDREKHVRQGHHYRKMSPAFTYTPKKLSKVFL